MAIEYLSINEAKEYLGISRTALWRLLKKGILATFSDPLDRRKRLIRRDDLDKLRQPQLRPKR